MRKNPFKRITAFALITALAISLAACSGSKNNETEAETSEDETKTSNRLQADWIDTAVMYEVNVRQYTQEGTFAAFEQHLTRLKDMGVNTLWFMPIYSISELNKKGTLGSYYAVRDYYSVNSEFGTLDDFKQLVDTAHEMGFHVVLDWVANHTGWDHTWITEHPEYYTTDDEGNIIYPYGTDWTDVADLNYENQEMRQAMIEAMKYWVSEVDVDGFRCDYAQGVPLDFWQQARAALDEIKPIYMLAEDGTNSDSLLLNAFDSNYHFRYYDMLKTCSQVAGMGDDLGNFVSYDAPYGSFKMNFLDNHDKNTYDGTLDERFGSDTLGALYTLIFTSEGMPLIYSGNEEDIDISLEFFEKDNIDFGDYKYSELLTKLCHIKTSYEPLYNGTAGAKANIITSDNNNVVAFSRSKGDIKITCVVNASAKEQNVKFDKGISKGNILLHGDSETMYDDENKALDTEKLNTLKPWEYYIIITE